MSYTAKFAIKKAGGEQFKVYALEGLWWSRDLSAFGGGDKSDGFTFDGHLHKHHEIYLGDPRRTKPEKLRTFIRQPYRHS